MSNRKRRGFTLMEIMVVICIMATMASIAAISFNDTKTTADQKTTRLTMKNVENALDLYRLQHNRYPSASEGLDVLVAERFLKESPLDAWGRPLRYELMNGEPLLSSLGMDGLPGGDQANADLTNRPSAAPQMVAQRF
jgi:general secretion pathway protein G